VIHLRCPHCRKLLEGFAFLANTLCPKCESGLLQPVEAWTELQLTAAERAS
jgi:phage FluMu protein Com